MLRLQKIVKEYPVASTKVVALKGLNLSFRENEFVAVLGPSGCGKTTLLNIIGGLDRYTKGDLLIRGKSTKHYRDVDWDTYRNHSIGFVFQTYNLIPHLSVLGNVELSLTISGIAKEDRKARAKKVLEDVGLGDQINKKPNQLSGGQMQRVAIARALINNPDIILADEPTGALDTKTSIQIMELLKEVAANRLVIMVTHNPDLANNYANRIIRLVDGEVVDDSNPFDGIEEKADTTKVRRSAMSFITALSLSFKNLITKKFRTILTSFAGSIGIIGIALVLSLSNGFNNYIDKVQRDSLSSYPLTVSDSSLDIAALISVMRDNSKPSKFPTDQLVNVDDIIAKLSSAMRKNVITQDYYDYIKATDPALLNGIIYGYGVDLSKYIFTNTNQEGLEYASLEFLNSFLSTGLPQGMNVSVGTPMIQILDSTESYGSEFGFVASQYDLLTGTWPKSKEEIVVIVNEYNEVADISLMMLGKYTAGKMQYTFGDILNWDFHLVTAPNAYRNTNGVFLDLTRYAALNQMNPSFDYADEMAASGNLKLKVSGIVRVNQQTAFGQLSTGVIGYSQELMDYLIAENVKSEIVKFMLDNPTIDPTTGVVYQSDDISGSYNTLLRSLGGNPLPNSFSIYAKNFDSKVAIKQYLDAYNVGKDDADKVIYSDTMEVMISSINSIIDVISIVLICFTAISLFVSSIMIAIITYVSVIERTKEIGVLRSIGARKKDISRVFNAETFIIGLTAGLFGVGVTYLLSFPINIIVETYTDMKGISDLFYLHAIALVLISIGLTLIAGFIPSRIAAKKDPVVALRTE